MTNTLCSYSRPYISDVTRRQRHALLTKSTSIMSTDSEMSTTSSASTLTTSTVIAEPTNVRAITIMQMMLLTHASSADI